MANGFKAVIAASVVGVVAWAFKRYQTDRADAEAQPVAYYVKQTPSSKSSAVPAIVDGLFALLESVPADQAQKPVFRSQNAPSSRIDTTTTAATVQATPISGGINGLLGLIGGIEAPQGYNQVYGGSKISPPRPLTSMTVGEVLDWQDQSVRAGSASSAAGRYQFIRGTLRGLVRQGAVSTSDRFDETTQDRLAVQLMKGRGLEDYQSGRISAEKFGQNLSQEWASLPVVFNDKRGRPANGQSYYSGDGLNKSLVDLNSVLSAIRSI